MKIIGLTGQSGAGKGAVSAILARNGFLCIDCDDVYHSLLIPPSKCLDEIKKTFGDGVIKRDGTLDRKKLGEAVFSDEEKLKKLNEITLHRVIDKCLEIIREKGDGGYVAAVLDAPTLYESGFDRECDTVLAVTADEETRISRIISRDGIDRKSALERIHAQKDESSYTSRADYVIRNDGCEKDLENATLKFIKKFGETKN